MGPATRDDYDIDDHFGQVGPALPALDWSSNCGTLSLGVALNAAHRAYVRASGQRATLRTQQVNTERRRMTEVPVRSGQLALTGDLVFGGAPGSGMQFELDCGDFSGSVLSRGLLPSGNALDRFERPGMGTIEASSIDASNLWLFVRARDFGLDPTALADVIQAGATLAALIEALRAAASRQCGFVAVRDVEAEMKHRISPLVFVVHWPLSYAGLKRVLVKADAYDAQTRSISRSALSRAHPGTGSMSTEIAAGIWGTIASDAMGREVLRGQKYDVRIGHPRGALRAVARLDPVGDIGQPKLNSAGLGRAARVLLKGRAYI